MLRLNVFLSLIVLVRAQSRLVQKAKLMQDGLDTSVDPCEDFFTFATKNYDKEFKRNRRKELLKTVLNEANVLIPSLRMVKNVYTNCGLQKPSANEFDLTMKAKRAVEQFHFAFPVTEADVTDDAEYMRKLARMYKMAFEYGSELVGMIQGSIEGQNLTIFLPPDIMSPDEKASVWKAYCAEKGCDHTQIDFNDFSNLLGSYAPFQMTPEYDKFLETMFGHKIRSPGVLFGVPETASF
ncbi:unnamed protein product [Bursaphelenchus okinawaensis]|uniref:Uncharacterized protein n=1 Tax=Bursaphelenchus okinawaensis TaxID=465554 RepID=A0A811KKJ5_9BILA|nr:unnamed protein product [Bursaphelenchus okinawaensis]CAG9105150.1 unnamed protein product [Bursaphelenchus okinawaensis]